MSDTTEKTTFNSAEIYDMINAYIKMQNGASESRTGG